MITPVKGNDLLFCVANWIWHDSIIVQREIVNSDYFHFLLVSKNTAYHYKDGIYTQEPYEKQKIDKVIMQNSVVSTSEKMVMALQLYANYVENVNVLL